MNLLHKEALQLASSLDEQEIPADVIRIVFPPLRIHRLEIRKKLHSQLDGARKKMDHESFS